MDTTFVEKKFICPVCLKEDTETLSASAVGELSDSRVQERLCFKADKTYPLRNISDCSIIDLRKKFPDKFKKAMGIPPRFMYASVADIGVQNQSKLKDRIYSLINGKHTQMVLFMGSAGLGKTHLAALLLNEICAPSTLNGKFVTFEDLMEQIKSSIVDNTCEEVVDMYTSVDILCIDELGGEKNSEYNNSKLYKIINNRYNNMKMTIVTTNETNESIIHKYEERILSRLVSGHVFGLEGDDRRKMDCKYTNAEV
jgi:hypothetical protein